jgi:hypothetical protein
MCGISDGFGRLTEVQDALRQLLITLASDVNTTFMNPVVDVMT